MRLEKISPPPSNQNVGFGGPGGYIQFYGFTSQTWDYVSQTTMCSHTLHPLYNGKEKQARVCKISIMFKFYMTSAIIRFS